MNILVIDDDKTMLATLQASIEIMGHNVSTAQTAEEAISKIVDKQKDLIISDIMMPGISGLSLISVLRNVHLCSTPIILMSVLNNQSLLDAAIAAGANDFIPKPFTVEELKAKIKLYDVTIS